MDIERAKRDSTVLVYNHEMAQILVQEYGIRNLVGVERSYKTHGKKAYEFNATNEIVKDLNTMIEDVREQRKQQSKSKCDNDLSSQIRDALKDVLGISNKE